MAKSLIINDITYYTYADLTDAEIYNNAIYGSTWSSLEEIVQKQLLVQASRKIDEYNYAGQKLEPNQPLKFPRIMSNGKISDDNVLIQLCCQIALYYWTNGTSSGGDTSNILSGLSKWQIGDVHVDVKDDAKFDLTGLDDFIEQALAEWLQNQGMQIWL